MTNNPDSKAPERIWCVYDGGSESRDEIPELFSDVEKDNLNIIARCYDAPIVEYARTDAIAPQQAAKVLLMVEHIEMIEDVAREYRVHQATLRAALKALADSKEIDG